MGRKCKVDPSAISNPLLLTLVTDGMFFELLHNSLNVFSVRDPECANQERIGQPSDKHINPVIY